MVRAYSENFEAIEAAHVGVDATDGPRIASVSTYLDLSSADIYPDGPRCIHGRPYSTSMLHFSATPFAVSTHGSALPPVQRLACLTTCVRGPLRCMACTSPS